MTEVNYNILEKDRYILKNLEVFKNRLDSNRFYEVVEVSKSNYHLRKFYPCKIDLNDWINIEDYIYKKYGFNRYNLPYFKTWDYIESKSVYKLSTAITILCTNGMMSNDENNLVLHCYDGSKGYYIKITDCISAMGYRTMIINNILE